MKKSQLLLTSLAANVCANSIRPMVFFAKSDTKWIPLSNALDTNQANIISFVMAESSHVPTEVSLQNNYAFTLDGDVGIYKNILVHGRGVEKSVLEFDDDMRLKHHQFHACKLSTDTVIMLGNSDPSCSKVSIYLLQYDKTTGMPVNAPRLPKVEGSKTILRESHERLIPEVNEDKQDLSSMDDLPHVFFIKTNTTLQPLSNTSWTMYGRSRSEIGVFDHRNTSEKPVEFTLRNGYAVTKDSQYAGYFNGRFGFGIAAHTQLNLDTTNKVKNNPFYSCQTFGESGRHLSPISYGSEFCIKAQIYLLPYNRTSGRPVEGSYLKKILQK